MTFKCDIEHFKLVIKEEMEDIFWLWYLVVWFWVQVFGFFGILLPSFNSAGLAIREDWNARMVIYTSQGIQNYADYSLFGSIQLEWLICDKIMFKYWLFHAINLLLPEMDPLEGLLKDLGLTDEEDQNAQGGRWRYSRIKFLLLILLIIINLYFC